MECVTIHDYDPSWPGMFEAFRARFSTLLGDLAFTIEHVGSTAVPGLAAKPIIDIDILLRSAAGLPLAIERLTSIGYEHRGDLGVAGREAFRTPRDGVRHHLYVCPPESKEYARHIAFRNYLRCHAEDANAYARLKRELAAKFGDDRAGYNDAKREFVETILQRASGEERKRVG